MSHLPALLDQPGYEARATRTLGTAEVAQFEAFAQDASALIRQAAETDFMTDDPTPVLDVPDGILPVAFRVIDRAIENRLGHSGQTDGSFTWQTPGISSGSAGVYLSDKDEADIRRALDPPETGFVAVTMSNFGLPGATG